MNPGTLESAKTGDVGALNILCEECYRQGVTCAYRKGAPSDLAQDFAQEATLRLFLRLPRMKSEAHCLAWVCLKAANLYIDWIRRYGREIDLAPLILPFVANAPELIDLEDCLRELPERERNVIEVQYLLGNSAEESAEILQISVGTVKSLGFRAKQHLADCIGKERKKGTQGRRAGGTIQALPEGDMN
jgi:RNA polymerase sigma-70 factor, ECF subfamily